MDFTGERYIPGIDADFALEHRHRYMLVCEFARDRDVLDIACGEGYGSAMLSTTARSVCGVDISAETVEHAKASYSAPNLTFLEGSAAEIPLPDASVDLVVSFETIEHHTLHHEMMQEIVRVLRPGGMMCLSSPERAVNADILPPNSNPYHVKELSRQELEDLVSGYFSTYHLYGQRSVMGSLICDDKEGQFSSLNNDTPDKVVNGVADPKFYIVLATNDTSLPSLAVGILESPDVTCQAYYDLLAWKVAVLVELEAEKAAHVTLQTHIGNLDEYIVTLQDTLVGERLAIVTLQDTLAGERLAIVALQDTLAGERLAFELRIKNLNMEIASMLNSKSWRCTKPLRQVADRLRTLRARIKTGIATMKHGIYRGINYIVLGIYTHWNYWRMLREAAPALCALQGRKISIHPWDTLKGRPELAAYFAAPDETLDKLIAITDETQRTTSVNGFKRAIELSGVPLPTFAADRLPRIVLISGEPHTPGHAYRMERLAHALSTDFQVYLYSAAEVDQHQNTILGADLLWIWRAIYTDTLSDLVSRVRAGGKHVIFDIDDLCFLPEMATAKFMDAIRSNGYNENEVKMYASLMQQLMHQADMCVASTLTLAQKISKQIGCPCKVLPNCFDRAIHDRSVAAYHKWKAEKDDDFIRIGYAAGTKTHQADLRVAVPALAAVLKRHPKARLVLFDEVIKLEEFPELLSFEGSIEWRDRVPLDCLPDEMARFDINLAPLEGGNPFCEAKSELKFFEAALVKVPTIASPTKPYADAIRHGETGYLASSQRDWEKALNSLVEDAALRERVGNEAYNSVLWGFGPENKQHLGLGIADSLVSTQRNKSRVFATDEIVNTDLPLSTKIPAYTVDFSTGPSLSKVAVVIPLHNYEVFVLEALNSLLTQTMKRFDVVVVDDASTDNSLDAVREWMQTHADRFASVSLLSNTQNARLSLTRNAGISYCHSEYVMLLDADNKLTPNCLELCAEALDTSSAAMAYPTIQEFGDLHGQRSARPWAPDLLRFGNYIDAMVMLRKAHWAALGGFTRQDQGWEDYDFWCKMAERGFWGIHVSKATADYRVHGASMLHTLTDKGHVKATLVDIMLRRHPWLCLDDDVSREPNDTPKA